MSRALTPQNYYRMPWSLTDNGISWLEVTTACNLTCEGCYRPKEKNSHKSLELISSELDVFEKERKSDCISIAGGDPLVHPKIVDIVKMIADRGWKAIVNTNGLALTKKRLSELKEAGAFGFTFHVDTTQDRRDSKVTTEREHNALRMKFAEMVADEGGLCCAFNQTVSSDSLDQVPDVVRWAQEHPDIVNSIVFILFRAPRLTGEFEFFANGKKIDLGSTYDKTGWGGQRILKAQDVVDKIREVDPEYEPCSYLSGTIDPHSTKWLIGTRVANSERGFGYVSPRFMEIVQETNHLLKGRWLAYSSPGFLRLGKPASFGLAAIDPTMKKIAGRYMRHALRKPRSLVKPAHFQTFGIIQPIDMMEDGRMNMCDGCPDMTVYNGKLYWSCRLEEVRQYGSFVSAAPRAKEQVARLTSPNVCRLPG